MKDLKKFELGQFYTKQSELIIGNLKKYINKDSIIIDPFAGEWDLLNLFPKNIKYGFDIELKNDKTIKRDTLLNPLNYSYYTIITNPPYLALNKSKDKIIFKKYNTNDLYKAALKSIIGCNDGIVIIPLNFFSSSDNEIRKEFLSKYKIKEVNVFEKPVFEDTTYTVCSFYFYREDNKSQNIKFNFENSQKSKEFTLFYEYGYKIGYEVYNQKTSSIKINRLIRGMKPNSNIFLRTVDTGSEGGEISLSFKKPYFGKKSDRVFATLVFSINLNEEEQRIIIKEFNKRIKEYRDKYNSLLFTNYRNGNRKRISFKFAYLIISNILRDTLGYE